MKMSFPSQRSMIFLSAAISLLAVGGAKAAIGAPKPAAVFVKASEIEATIKQLSAIYTDDEPVRVGDAGPLNVGVFVVGRPKQVAEAPVAPDGTVRVTEGLVLDHVTAVVRILTGAGTFVTGGTLVDQHRIANDDPDLPVIGPGSRGKLVRGGEARHVAAGDMVIVPAGVEHGFSAIEQPLTYMVIRIDAAKVLPLK